MGEMKKILVAYDGSPHSKEALNRNQRTWDA